MIIVIKITITVIMKIIIVLKLMKIVAQSHNPKTYRCSNYDNVQHVQIIAEHCRYKFNSARVPKTETFTHFLQH